MPLAVEAPQGSSRNGQFPKFLDQVNSLTITLALVSLVSGIFL